MWAAATVVTPPVGSAIPLADVKEFLRITDDVTDFDAQLEAFAATAAAHIEVMCGIRFAPQTVELRADGWDDMARLPIGPVTDIVSIHYLDREGVENLLDSALYELVGADLAMGIRRTAGSNWPNDVRSVTGAIRVRAEVGYAEVPRPLWAAALYLTGDMFAFRETAAVGTAAAKVPLSASVEAMLANYRIWL